MKRIEAAIAEAEEHTDTDLSLVVTRASDRYALYPPLWAAFVALLITTVLAILRPGLSIRAAIFIQVPLLITLTLLFDWLPLRLLIIPQQVKRTHARRLA